MDIHKMMGYKKNEELTYEDFARKQMRLFGEWHVYYREHAIREFESLVEYRTGMFWDLVGGGDGEGRRQAEVGLNKVLIEEMKYQLEKDKEENYYEKELSK